MKKACINVSGVIWTLTYNEHPNNTITIVNFDKEDNDGYMFQESLGVLQSIQYVDGSDKVVDSVTIGNVVYDVQNKENVYSYKLPL